MTSTPQAQGPTMLAAITTALATFQAAPPDRMSACTHTCQILDATATLRDLTQACHWNVRGANFPALHGLFGDQYEDLATAVDDLAENIRARRSLVSLRLTGAAFDPGGSADSMLRRLALAHEELVGLCQRGAEAADLEHDVATVDLLSKRAGVHEKAAWFLRSTCEEPHDAPSIGNGTWVELGAPMGKALWAAAHGNGGQLYKGASIDIAALPGWAARMLAPDELAKHTGVVQYVKRVPTGKFRQTKSGKTGAMIYRYYYHVAHGGGIGNHADMKAGASFKHGAGEYTVHGVKDGKLVVSHSSRPKKHETITHDELAKRLHEHHGVAVEAHHAKLKERLHRELGEAKEFGSPKHVANLLAEMKRRGIEPPGEAAPKQADEPDEKGKVDTETKAPAKPAKGDKAWEDWGDRPKDAPVDFSGHPLAHWLKEQGVEKFVNVTVKKVGVERGRGAEKKVYGNAKVQAQAVFGFDYGQMLKDSYKALDTMPQALIEKALASHGWKGDTKIPITQDDVDTALREIRESLERSLAGGNDKETGLRPLEVNGQKIRGAHVYRGDEDNYTGPKDNPPEPGTIYIDAVTTHSFEIEPAEHGEYAQDSMGAVTRAKEILRSHLPVSGYKRYRLNPSDNWKLRVSGQEFTIDDVRAMLAKDGIEVPMKKAKGGWMIDGEGEGWDPDDPFSVYGELEPGPDGVIDLGDLLGTSTMAKGGTWVELAPELGEALTSHVLAKGGAFDAEGWLELPAWAARVLDPEGLWKAGGGPFLKKVPTGKFRTKKDGSAGAPIYRYFYKVQHGGGVHNAADFNAGASFAHGEGHYTIHGVKDGKLTVSHSSNGKKVKMTHAELSAKLAEHHKVALDAHKAKLSGEHADAVAAGNVKGAAKIRAEAAKMGHWLGGHEHGGPALEAAAKDKAREAPKADPHGGHPPEAAEATNQHPKAVHPKDMDPDGRYTTWTKRPDMSQWVVGRTRSGQGFGPGADLIGTKRGTYGDQTIAAFPHGTDPNAKDDNPDKFASPENQAKMRAARAAFESARTAHNATLDKQMKAHEPGTKPHERAKSTKEYIGGFDMGKHHPEESLDVMNGAMEAHDDAAKRDAPKAEPTKAAEASGPAHADHLASAKSTYGLTDKDMEHVAKHAYAKQAEEHAKAGDHDRAKGMIRLAVKDRLTRDQDRNLSASQAERNMKEREKMKKALASFGTLFKAWIG